MTTTNNETEHVGLMINVTFIDKMRRKMEKGVSSQTELAADGRERERRQHRQWTFVSRKSSITGRPSPSSPGLSYCSEVKTLRVSVTLQVIYI